MRCPSAAFPVSPRSEKHLFSARHYGLRRNQRQEQRPDLVDTLVGHVRLRSCLWMYADGHLTTMEDEQLQKLLTAMGHAEESERQREFDAAVTRIRPFVASLQIAKAHALTLIGASTDRRQQKQVYAAVQHIMTFDQHVSTWETTLLSELRLKFKL